MPAFGGVFGAGVDQVEGDALEVFLRGGEGFQAFVDVVEAAKEVQGFIVQRLEAEADAVDAGLREIGELAGFDRGGVGF